MFTTSTNRIDPRFVIGLLMLLGCQCVALPVVAAEEPGKRYAILAGVADYDHEKLAKLEFTENDAVELAAVLEKAGYVTALLCDSAGKKQSSALPTRANIDAVLGKVVNRATKRDTIIVALMGHGLHFTGDKDSYFCPKDARPIAERKDTLVSLDGVYKQLDNSGAGVKVLFVDACRNDPDPGRGRGIDADTAPLPPKGVAALFSCSQGERAFEHRDLKHGVFTHFVLKGLKGEAQDRDGEITFQGLAGYVQKQTAREVPRLFENRQQSPNLKADLSGTPAVLLSVSDLARLEGRPAPIPDSPKVVVRPTPMPESPKPVVPSPDPSPAKAGEVVTNSLGMKLKLIPAGRFTMGSPASEAGHDDSETQAEVTLTKPFYLGTTTVTQGEWKQLMKTEPWKGKEHVKEGTNYPATYVNWDDAQEFCKALSEKEGKKYRLPTEAEWEYACRAGTKTAYSFGADASRLGDYAWFSENADKIKEEYAHEVGQKKPNDYVLFDMHGNVWQWCEDSYAEKLPGGSDPLVSTGGSFRVNRGGCWFFDAVYCRSADRIWDSPDFRLNDLGFRLALVPSS